MMGRRHPDGQVYTKQWLEVCGLAAQKIRVRSQQTAGAVESR